MTIRNPTKQNPAAFAIFDDKFIVTANEDGSIPLNSKVVIDLPKGGIQQDLTEIMVHRANTQPKLLEAAKNLVGFMQDNEEWKDYWKWIEAVNAAILASELNDIKVVK